jgi:thioredoxin-dependent peroxiredoxin
MSDYSSLQKLADITVHTDTGEAVTLAHYVGKRTLLFFFPKADTPGCTTQACGFRDAFPKIEANGAVVLGISPDSPEDLAKWRAKQKLPYTLISDAEHKLADRFGVWGEKTMFGHKFMGVTRSHFVYGPDGALEQAEEKISPQDSIDKGVAALIK